MFLFDHGSDMSSMNEHDIMPTSIDLSGVTAYWGGGRQDTYLGLCLFCIPSELVMDHLGKGVSAIFQPDLSCLIVRVCQHLEVQARVLISLRHRKAWYGEMLA